jgi:hypothetical protein
MQTYHDSETLIKEWLINSSVANLVEKNNYIHIYLAMPKGSPSTAVILSRVGGGTTTLSDVPQDSARISFSAWGANRVTAANIAGAIVSECENLSYIHPYETDNASLVSAEVINWGWFPDGESARYIVDVIFTIINK